MKFLEQVAVAIMTLFTMLFTILSTTDITYCLQIYILSNWHNRISCKKENPTIDIEISNYRYSIVIDIVLLK